MATTSVQYTGDGSTVLYSFPFPYIEETDVKAAIDGVVTTAFTIENTNTIRFDAPPAVGADVAIFRRTSTEDLPYVFYPGSAIKAKDLNEDFSQILYVAQELRESTIDNETGGEINGDIIFDGNVTINKYPENDTDAANKLYVDTQDQKIYEWATDTFVDVTGDTMTGQLNTIPPVAPTNAVNKAYVDSIFVSAGGDTSALPTTRYLVIAKGGETRFVPPAAFSPGNELMFVNGAQQAREYDYTTEGLLAIVFKQPLLKGDVVEMVCYNNIKVVEVSSNFDTFPTTYWVKTATAGQTEFKGTGDSSPIELGYTPGKEVVYLNGSALIRSVDYTVDTVEGDGTNGIGIILTQPALEGDVMLVQCDNYARTGTPEFPGLDYTYPGGVPRPLQSRLEDYVSVKDFGAVGDGSTDDTAAIQSAVNSLNPNQTLSLAGGQYVCNGVQVSTDSITITSGKLIGTTASNRLEISGDNVTLTDIEFFIENPSLHTNCGGVAVIGNNCTITKCYFNNCARRNTSSSPDSKAHYHLNLYDGHGHIVSSCVFGGGHFTEQLFIHDATYCSIVNNTLTGNNNIYSAIATSSSNPGYHTIQGNTCNNYRTSIITINSDYNTVIGNVCDTSAEEQGINVGHTNNSAHNTVVQGNVIKNVRAGVFVADSNNCIVSNNFITNVSYAFIGASKSNDILVTGNSGNNAALNDTLEGYGCRIYNSDTVTITNNYFKSMNAHGFYFSNLTTRATIDSNTLTNVHDYPGGLGGQRMGILFSAGGSDDFELTINNLNIISDASQIGIGPPRGVQIDDGRSNIALRITNCNFSGVTSSQMFYLNGGSQPTNRTLSKIYRDTQVKMTALVTLSSSDDSITVNNINQVANNFYPTLIPTSAAAVDRSLYVSSVATGSFTVSAGNSGGDASFVYIIN